MPSIFGYRQKGLFLSDLIHLKLAEVREQRIEKEGKKKQETKTNVLFNLC